MRVTATSAGEVAPRAVSPRDASLRIVRIALARGVSQARVSADGDWTLSANDGTTLADAPRAGEGYVLEPSGGRISVRRDDGSLLPERFGSLTARPVGASLLSFAGRRWRGELTVSVDEAGRLLVIDRVPMDDYLKGVVPLEIGTRAMSDFAAAEAQAVAARSYAYMHLAGPGRPYDMLATVSDQVYGGVTAETLLGNQAVENTSGLVLMYDGRVVNAPYHGNCGGFTAEPGDAWRSGPEPYLRRVSDQIPGSDRFYCDIAPRFRWERSWRSDSLATIVDRYVRAQSDEGADRFAARFGERDADGCEDRADHRQPLVDMPAD